MNDLNWAKIVIPIVCFIAGFLLGIRYLIWVYRKYPSFHFISAEARVRAEAFAAHLRNLEDK